MNVDGRFTSHVGQMADGRVLQLTQSLGTKATLFLSQTKFLFIKNRDLYLYLLSKARVFLNDAIDYTMHRHGPKTKLQLSIQDLEAITKHEIDCKIRFASDNLQGVVLDSVQLLPG